MFAISGYNKRTRYLTIGLVLAALLILTGCGARKAAVPTSEPSVAPAATATEVMAVETLPPTEPAAGEASTFESAVATPADAATTFESALATDPAPATQPPATTAAPAAAAPRPIDLQQVATASHPVFLTYAGDDSGRLFVVEKRGTIRILQDGALSKDFFLDIRDRVNSDSSERGLLGLAFAPNYRESGFFFVNYTDASGATVVSRFQVSADPNRADPASEFNVLKIDQPAPNHNGGDLVFGPDGYLWIGTGDGGAANDRYGNGQNPRTLLGKMLRIDVTTDPTRPYLVPADNPWTRADWNGKDVRDEVWSVGMRNPWRFSFDRATNDLWIADVGQNQYEEVNMIPAGSAGGLNFGWPIMEGLHCFPDTSMCDQTGLVLPVAEYTHQGNCSVTGGYVYRGADLSELTGTYLYGDFCSGVIWGLSQQGGEWVNRELLKSGLAISSFAEDARGELYVLDLNDGGIYRFVAQ